MHRLLLTVNRWPAAEDSMVAFGIISTPNSPHYERVSHATVLASLLIGAPQPGG
jgi:hypothetical protein